MADARNEIRADVSGFDEIPGSTTLPGFPVCTLSATVRGPRDDTVVSDPVSQEHVVTGIHFCMDVHEDYHGITLHVCNCGARFYFVRDAVEVLVGGFVRLKTEILALQSQASTLDERDPGVGW